MKRAKNTPSSSLLRELMLQPPIMRAMPQDMLPLLQQMQPLAERIATACETIQQQLNDPKAAMLYKEFQCFTPPSLSYNAGKIIADNPLSSVSRLFADQIARSIDQLEHSPSPQLTQAQLINLRAGFSKLVRFVHPPLLGFADHLAQSVIPTLEASTGFGAPGVNQRLLDIAQQIQRDINALAPTLLELGAHCANLMAVLPANDVKGKGFA